jgi:hypothetical protein
MNQIKLNVDELKSFVKHIIKNNQFKDFKLYIYEKY